MKKIIQIIILFPIFVSSQTIEKFEKDKNRITRNIILLQDSIKILDLEIQKIKSSEILKASKDSSIIAFAKGNAKLRKNPDVMSEVILEIAPKTKVIVMDYDEEFFGVCVDSVCGYMNEIWLTPTKQTDNLKKLKIDQKAELKRIIALQEMARQEKNEKLEDARNLKKYGAIIFKKLKQHYYWTGMNKEMAIISLGEPNSINRTVGVWGIHEQWVYDNIYLYFENGKLKSYQD